VDHGAGFLGKSTHPRTILAASIARYHHERWDGGGYPEGLRGEGIPPAARMCAIADAFEQLVRHDCSDVGLTKAVDEIGRGSGTRFDPRLVQFFVTSVKQGYIHHHIQSDGTKFSGRTNDLDKIMKRFAR